MLTTKLWFILRFIVMYPAVLALSLVILPVEAFTFVWGKLSEDL